MHEPIKRISFQATFALALMSLLPGCGTLGTVANLDVDFEDAQLIVHPIDELRRFRWSFDTGSDLTLLDEGAFSDVSLIPTKVTAVITGTTGRKIERPIEVLKELPLKRRNGAMPFRLENLWVIRVPNLRANTGFDAILGYRPFRHRIVEMDLGRSRVRIRAWGANGPGVEHLPLTFDEWRPIVEVPSSAGYSFPAIVDTGSNSWFSLTNADRRALEIDNPLEAGRLTRGALGETTHSLYQFKGSFSLGHAEFRNPIVTGTRELSESLLGVLALRFVRLTLDPVKERASVEVLRMPWTRGGFPPRRVTITSVLAVVPEGEVEPAPPARRAHKYRRR